MPSKESPPPAATTPAAAAPRQPEPITIDEAARRLFVSLPHVRRLLAQGEIPAASGAPDDSSCVDAAAVLRYQRAQEARRAVALAQLVTASEAMRLYDAKPEPKPDAAGTPRR